MKYTFILCVLLVFAGFKSNNKYTLTGSFSGDQEEEWIYMVKIGEKKPLLWSGKKMFLTIDTIPQVYYFDRNKSNRESAIFINGQLVHTSIMKTIDPNLIERIQVEKQESEIDDRKYYGKILIQMKAGYRPKFISLTELRSKYITKDQCPVLFFIDDKLVSEGYDDFFVDEKYILKILVEPLNNPEEKLGLNVVRLVTKTEENIRKSKQIILR